LLHEVDQSDNLQKTAILKEICQGMSHYNLDDLQIIQHVMEALNKTKEQDFHFFGHSLGIEWKTENEVVMHLGLHNANRYGKAQGGALYTLADVTIAEPILRKLPENANLYTLEMKMNYMKKGEGKLLRAKANILHWGRKTVVGECSIQDETGALVAKAMGTFYIAQKENV
jgi:uncharacterized protein (TIGR00369 family)